MVRRFGYFLFCFALAGATPAFAFGPGLSPESKGLIDQFYREFAADDFRVQVSVPVLDARWQRLARDWSRISKNEFLCNRLLGGTRFHDFFAGSPTAEELRANFLFYRDQIQSPKRLPVIADFLKLPDHERRATLKNLIENFNEMDARFAQHTADLGGNKYLIQDPADYFFASLLGIPFRKTEESIRHDEPKWLALHWAALQANIDLNSRLSDLEYVQRALGSLNGRMVDIGSGYGIPGIYFSLRNPNFSYLGIDLVGAKTRASRWIADHLGLPALAFATQNVRAMPTLPDAKYYFFFNPVNKNVLDEVLATIGAQRPAHDTYLILTHIERHLEIPRAFSVYAASTQKVIRIYRRPGWAP